MDFVIIMVILALVVVFITAPLRRLPAPGEIVPDAEADGAEPRVRELRDAELDYRTGKLSDADYRAVDATLRAEAIEILRSLDEAREQLPDHEGQDRPAADTITG